jgi:hypothetical protein
VVLAWARSFYARRLSYSLQRALAAFLAISFRFLDESPAARAFPPMRGANSVSALGHYRHSNR